MDHLEQRVQALEQEVHLLKSQIRATLLDIQEQLLTGAYPSLRKDGETPQPSPTMREAPPSPIKQVKPAPPRMLPDEPEYAPAMGPEETFPFDVPALNADRPFFNVTDWSVLESIAQWITTKVEEIGPERTRSILETYAQNQYWDPSIADALMQFSSAPNAFKLTNKPGAEPSPKEKKDTSERFRRAVANIGRR